MATYALLMIDGDDEPHLARPQNGTLLCGKEYAGSIQYAVLSEPTPTTCAACARRARFLEET